MTASGLEKSDDGKNRFYSALNMPYPNGKIIAAKFYNLGPYMVLLNQATSTNRNQANNGRVRVFSLRGFTLHVIWGVLQIVFLVFSMSSPSRRKDSKAFWPSPVLLAP